MVCSYDASCDKAQEGKGLDGHVKRPSLPSDNLIHDTAVGFEVLLLLLGACVSRLQLGGMD